MANIKPIAILDSLEFFTNEDLCIECDYNNKSFLCNKKYATGMKEAYLKQYDIKIYVYKFPINNLRKIIDKIHDAELYHHRSGAYFALQCTNFHCGESCNCECSKDRCWDFKKVPSRRQPHCIKFFGLNIPKYNKNYYAFILSNLESDNIELYKPKKLVQKGTRPKKVIERKVEQKKTQKKMEKKEVKKKKEKKEIKKKVISIETKPRPNRMTKKDPIVIKPSISMLCNRRCGFCAMKTMDLSYLEKSNFSGNMSLKLAEQVSMSIGEWLPNGIRFECGGFGEPMINKDIVDIMQIFKEHNPKSQILVYTNQLGITRIKLEELFEAGVNIIFLDSYEKRDVKKARSYKDIFEGIFEFHEYENTKFNPYRKHKKDIKVICHQDYSNATTEGYNKRTKKLHNYAGNIAEDAYKIYDIEKIINPLHKMCVRPFRELAISPDGIVPICCLDFHRELVIGKFPEEDLKDIWYKHTTDAVRLSLLSKTRSFRPCNMCSHVGTRVGLVNKPEPTKDNLNGLISSLVQEFTKYKINWKE